MHLLRLAYALIALCAAVHGATLDDIHIEARAPAIERHIKRR